MKNATNLYIDLTNINANPEAALNAAKQLDALCRDAKARRDKAVSDYWHARQQSTDTKPSLVDLDAHIITIPETVDPLLLGDLDNVSVNQRGNIVVYSHNSCSRYLFDFDLCRCEDGWLQYDTNQDASYFGVWVNKKKRMTVTYAEGDISIVRCPTDESFNAEIDSMNEFYDEGFICKAFNADGFTTYRQDREQFYLQEVECGAAS